MKDKERRQRLREEKLEAQRALQEERVQRALERAKAPVMKKVMHLLKKTGKPVVFRSAPPQKKKLKETNSKKKEEGILSTDLKKISSIIGHEPFSFNKLCMHHARMRHLLTCVNHQ